MKRILILFVIALALFGSVVSFGQNGNKLPLRVPKGKTFVYFNSNRKEIGRSRSGQLARKKHILDCVTIDCPTTFPKDTVCWECRERPAIMSQ
jgi:hypothetical protein